MTISKCEGVASKGSGYEESDCAKSKNGIKLSNPERKFFILIDGIGKKQVLICKVTNSYIHYTLSVCLFMLCSE